MDDFLQVSTCAARSSPVVPESCFLAGLYTLRFLSIVSMPSCHLLLQVCTCRELPSSVFRYVVLFSSDREIAGSASVGGPVGSKCDNQSIDRSKNKNISNQPQEQSRWGFKGSETDRRASAPRILPECATVSRPPTVGPGPEPEALLVEASPGKQTVASAL